MFHMSIIVDIVREIRDQLSPLELGSRRSELDNPQLDSRLFDPLMSQLRHQLHQQLELAIQRKFYARQL